MRNIYGPTIWNFCQLNRLYAKTNTDNSSSVVKEAPYMSSAIFIIGAITDEMRASLSPDFILHDVAQMDDVETWLAANGQTIKYVLTNGHDGIADDWVTNMPNLKLISNYGVGYDAINAQAARASDILVTHTPDVLNDEVATTAIMLMLACYRELRASDQHIRSGAWGAGEMLTLSRSADHRRVGIVGLGRIGLAIADKLTAFHANIAYHSRSEKDVPFTYYADLQEMAKDCEALIVITPGGDETKHLVSKDVIEALGPDGVLINVARGTVVDEGALVDALANGTLGAAGLDVFEQEPHVPAALLDMPNVVVTPHIGSATIETRRAMGQLTVNNIISHAKTGKVFSPVPECRDIAELA